MLTRQEYMELQERYEKEGQAVISSIANVLYGTSQIGRNALVASAYVLLMADDKEVSLASIKDFCLSVNADADREAFIESSIGDVWPMVAGQRHRYSAEALKSVILFYEDKNARFMDEFKTPTAISRLACRIFGFGENDEVADFGVGSAAFITEAFLDKPDLRFYGVDINASVKEIAAIKLEVLGCKACLEQGSVFDLDPSLKYQNIFTNYPFALKARDLGLDHDRLLQRIMQDSKAFSKRISSDWFYNVAAVECLKSGGKAIAIMTNGGTWNTSDMPVRKFFIEKGYLEAVIALPSKLFGSTVIAVTMVVLSRHNQKTMLVDATGIFEKGRRYNTLSEEQVDRIAHAALHETDISMSVSEKDFAENDYVINPTRYLASEVVVEEGRPFADIIKSITRGAPVRASDLDRMVSDEPTDYQYLMLANIQKGMIEADLPYLKGIQENHRRYCVKDRSLIISKNGKPFKVAIAEVEPGKTILASGNLYIVEIDEEKADPFFVKAFLESEKGTAQLNAVSVGATISTVGVDALKRILIPNIPLAKQHSIAEKYAAKMEEIALYERKLKKAYEDLAHIYDNEG